MDIVAIFNFPASDVRAWWTFEKLALRPLLADRGCDPECVDHVVAQVRILYDKHAIGRAIPVTTTRGDVRAFLQAWDLAKDIYMPMVLNLLWECALLEISLYHSSGGATGKGTKANDPPQRSADVLKFSPRVGPTEPLG